MKALLIILSCLILTYASQPPQVGDRVISKPVQCKNLGMTWGFISHDCKLEIDKVGCSGLPASPLAGGQCNAYKGDTPCQKSLPILCIKKLRLNRPAYDVDCSPHAMTKEFYCGWSGAFLALTPPIQGCLLTNATVADAYCQKYIGCGYEMAAHSDGFYQVGMSSTAFANCAWDWSVALSGGWAFYGYSNLWKVQSSNQVKPPTRFWTKINDQPANCWDSLGHN